MSVIFDIDNLFIARALLKKPHTFFRANIQLKDGTIIEEEIPAETVGEVANIVFQKYELILDTVQIGGKR